jgi:hypothetical protein
MIYFLALIPATALTIAGYFALYLSNRSEGAFRTFGKYLGFWAFTLAGLVVLGAIFAAAHGGRHWHARHEGPRFGRPPFALPSAPDGAAGPAAPPAPASPPPH